MSIGEVGERAGLQPSAIRYYERIGLLPKPPRAGGKRRYDPSVLEWLSLIALAREAGFTMREIKRLVSGFTPGTSPAARWKELATRKLAEIDEMVARAERMRAVLRVAIDCGCFRMEDCSALLHAGPVDGQSPCVMPARQARSSQSSEGRAPASIAESIASASRSSSKSTPRRRSSAAT